MCNQILTLPHTHIHTTQFCFNFDRRPPFFCNRLKPLLNYILWFRDFNFAFSALVFCFLLSNVQVHGSNFCCFFFPFYFYFLFCFFIFLNWFNNFLNFFSQHRQNSKAFFLHSVRFCDVKFSKWSRLDPCFLHKKRIFSTSTPFQHLINIYLKECRTDYFRYVRGWRKWSSISLTYSSHVSNIVSPILFLSHSLSISLSIPIILFFFHSSIPQTFTLINFA